MTFSLGAGNSRVFLAQELRPTSCVDLHKLPALSGMQLIFLIVQSRVRWVAFDLPFSSDLAFSSDLVQKSLSRVVLKGTEVTRVLNVCALRDERVGGAEKLYLPLAAFLGHNI